MNLDLRRKLIQVMGWQLFNYETGMYATTDEDIADALNNDGYTLEGWDDRREAWEFDPMKPDISEPLFLQWTWKNDYGWNMDTAVTYDDVKWPLFSITLLHDRGEGMLMEEMFTVYGASPSEARALAIVEASRKGAL